MMNPQEVMKIVGWVERSETQQNLVGWVKGQRNPTY
jgi:hypothetical protein